MTSKTALVTGASSGIGEATARKLQTLGFTVYGAARRLDRLQKLSVNGIRPLAMDVTNDASMQAGIDQIIAETGRIDVLVNNAGYGSYGALEDVDIDEGRRQFEVNVFGAMRLAQLVLPYMRTQRAGTIVNITSMGGKIYTPLGGWYRGEVRPRSTQRLPPSRGQALRDRRRHRRARRDRHRMGRYRRNTPRGDLRDRRLQSSGRCSRKVPSFRGECEPELSSHGHCRRDRQGRHGPPAEDKVRGRIRCEATNRRWRPALRPPVRRAHLARHRPSPKVAVPAS